MWACSVGVVLSLVYAFDQAFGLDVPFYVSMALVAVTAFLTTIPITPGNVGTFQWIVIGLMKQIYGEGLSKEVVVGFSIIFHILNMAPVWITGIFFFIHDHFRVGEIRKESIGEEFPETARDTIQETEREQPSLPENRHLDEHIAKPARKKA